MGILESIAGLLLLFWVIGLIFHIAGAFIHVLLVIAVVLFIARFFTRSSSA